MYYTYKQLLEALQELSEEELQLTATIYNVENDAFAPVEYTDKTKCDDVLESDHPVIAINDPTNYHDSCKV